MDSVSEDAGPYIHSYILDEVLPAPEAFPTGNATLKRWLKRNFAVGQNMWHVTCDMLQGDDVAFITGTKLRNQNGSSLE